ncbi:MAG TPA: hypothetical protein VFZ18_00285 [Longimicrobiaceae bacterium]
MRSRTCATSCSALLGVAAALALAGCTGVDAEGNDLDSLPVLTAREDARIGDFDDPGLGFSRVYQVEIDRDSNLYVLEGSIPEIRVFSPEGALRRRIGRRGGGPGEFQSARFGLLGDTLWTVDSRLNRITLFDRLGTVLSTGTIERAAVALPSGFGYLLPRVMRPDGRFMGHLGMVAFSRDEPTGVKPTDSIPVPLVLFAASGEVIDTVGWAPRPPPRMWRPPAEEETKIEYVNVGDRRFLVPTAPITMPEWLPVGDGYITVETPLAETAEEGTVRVTRFGLAGDTVYRRELRYSPLRYADAALDSIAARAARGAAGGMLPFAMEGGSAPPPPENPEAVARALRGAMSFPDFQLPIQSSWLAQDESVWMRRPDDNTPRARWILLDPQGEPRGQLELPSDLRILWNVGDTFWAVDLDEYDVPWVVRYRITEG